MTGGLWMPAVLTIGGNILIRFHLLPKSEGVPQSNPQPLGKRLQQVNLNLHTGYTRALQSCRGSIAMAGQKWMQGSFTTLLKRWIGSFGNLNHIGTMEDVGGPFCLLTDSPAFPFYLLDSQIVYNIKKGGLHPFPVYWLLQAVKISLENKPFRAIR